MALDLRLNQKLDLQLKLAPQIIQSIEILQLPSIDLQELIQAELDTNEYLETVSSATEETPPAPTTETPATGTEEVATERERDREIDRLESYGVWDDEMPRFKSAINQEASDRKQEAMNNTADRSPSLHEKLLDQLRLLEMNPMERAFGERVVSYVNGAGRLDADLEIIRQEFLEQIEVEGAPSEDDEAATDAASPPPDDSEREFDLDGIGRDTGAIDDAMGVSTSASDIGSAELTGPAESKVDIDEHAAANGDVDAQGEGDAETEDAEFFSAEQGEAVLRRIQSLEPRGIAARSTEECLLLQLDVDDPSYELKRRLIVEHLEDLAKNRRPKIAKSLGVGFEGLEQLVLEIAELDYQPGVSLADESPHYIYPDIVVDWTTEGYEVRLAGETYPELRLADTYRDVLGDAEVPAEYKDQVRKKIDSAKWLISALDQRQSTLLRVARRIVDYQRDFLDFGPHELRPLKMQQVADDLGIHVSTVSRATHEKYMQTHRGIFSMKYFFTGAATSVDGGMESRASVRQRVKEIINLEDKRHPLSDEEIVKRLRRNFGVEVARRTVTKYRKALSIPSTRQRRVY